MDRRLYQITDTETGKPAEGVRCFSNKLLAKAERNRLNTEHSPALRHLRYVVSPGPDHYRFKSRK